MGSFPKSQKPKGPQEALYHQKPNFLLPTLEQSGLTPQEFGILKSLVLKQTYDGHLTTQEIVALNGLLTTVEMNKEKKTLPHPGQFEDLPMALLDSLDQIISPKAKPSYMTNVSTATSSVASSFDKLTASVAVAKMTLANLKPYLPSPLHAKESDMNPSQNQKPTKKAHGPTTEFMVSKDIYKHCYHVGMLTRDGKNVGIAQPVTFETFEEDEAGMHGSSPMMELRYEAAQRLMTELWNCGLRPDGFVATEESAKGMIAMQGQHLEDMRKIAFAFIESTVDLKK